MVNFLPQSNLPLETKRLVLEPITADHAAKLFESFQDEELCRFIHRPSSVTELEAKFRRFESHGPDAGTQVWLNWATKDKQLQAYVGWFQATLYAGQTASLSYVVFSAYWRQGYAIEACGAMIDHLLGIYGAKLLFVTMDPKNLASIAVARKLGFRHITHYNAKDEYRYEISHAEWLQAGSTVSNARSAGGPG